MKKLLKKCTQLLPLSPAIIIALAAISGFTLSKPELKKVIWPEKPNITVIAKENKKDKKANKKEKKEEKAGVGNYKDGTFTGKGNGYGGTTTVQVTVSKKQITDVEVLSHSDTVSYFKIAKDKMISSILLKQTWEVDSVSGATYSSRGIKEAVCNALTGKTTESALPKKTKPKTSLKNSKYKKTAWNDGSYEGSATGFGGPIRVRVTIQDGKITSIEILSHSGETESYFSKAKNIVKHILKKQSPNVDTISGATYSSAGIREAVKNALTKAAKKKDKKNSDNNDTTDKANDSGEADKQDDSKQADTKVPDGKPADGTYAATADCQQGKRFNYKVEITATFKDGKLINLSMQTSDSGKNQSYIDEAWSGLKNSIMANNNGNVDAVSGATYTSNAIKKAYKEAYKKAVEAGGGNVEEESPSKEASTEVSENPSEESTENSSTEEGENPSENPDEPSENSDEKMQESTEEPSGETDEKTEETTEKPKPSGPRNGSYNVTATVDADDAKKSNQKGQFYNYKISGTVTFKDGKLSGISNISLVSNTVDEEEYEDDEYYTGKAASGMVGKLKNANSADVDIVSGATCSSKAIIKLYKEAYDQAMSEE